MCLMNGCYLFDLIYLFYHLGVFSQTITVTPNTTPIDILEGGNFTIDYKIDPGRLTNWSVEMNFDNIPLPFFVHKKNGQSFTPPDGCINCNVTYNNLTKTFTLHLYNVTKNNNSGTYGFVLKNRSGADKPMSHQIVINVRGKPKILQPKKKLVKVYDNLKTFNVCFTGFPVPNVTLHVANNTNIINKDILTTESTVHTIDLMVLLNNSGSGVKTGNYRLEMWNELGKANLDIQLICHKRHGSGGLEMIIAVAAACLMLGLCFLIGVFCIRRKQIKKQTTEESYRDNSLYISSGPTLTNNGDSARNVNNQRQEAAGRTTSDGSYRDNTLYAPCTTEQLQKLNADKKSSVKETETSKRGKKQEKHCHGDDEDYQYLYVNLPENFITKQRKHKVGNHKSKKNKTSQGKKNEDTQDKRLISKRKNDMRIDEHNNMLEKSPEYEQEIKAKSNNSMDEYCAETTVPRIPPKTALAFQADYSL
ncbi:hypothetical protein KUTeg_007819 [Tegillarca granosa]|uniref:Uncharacterized protein n=1 Tax=Tegillarca granosa TaxID=220873 RepID=A0ABQ9FEB4_TEGGR|nr:hypothetical protein KUTeg_007819 [Tegillarca granosa]